MRLDENLTVSKCVRMKSHQKNAHQNWLGFEVQDSLGKHIYFASNLDGNEQMKSTTQTSTHIWLECEVECACVYIHMCTYAYINLSVIATFLYLSFSGSLLALPFQSSRLLYIVSMEFDSASGIHR